MAQPSRTRRILKWTGAGLALSTFAIWVSSLWCRVCLSPADNYAIKVDMGEVVIWSSNIPYALSMLADPGIKIHDLNEVGFKWLDFAPRVRFGSHQPIGGYLSTTSIPLWLLLLAIGTPTAWLWHRDRRRIRPGHCPRCGYDLTGNTSGVCSECGEPKPPPAIV